MTDPQPGAPESAAPPSPAGGSPTGGRSPQAGQPPSGRAATGRALAQSVGAVAGRIGNWLGSIGWGKFVLLSLLLVALSGMVDSIFSFSHKRHRHDSDTPVEVKVTVDTQGLHVAGSPQAETAHTPPKLRIDKKGLRVESDKNGHKSTVVIDENGIRVENAASGKGGASTAPPTPGAAAPGADEIPSGPVVTVPPGVLSDPDKVAEAVDSAKDQIEEIVQDQVNRRVARLTEERHSQEDSLPDLAELAVMTVFALLILKIALGSKRRAESRAKAADAVAAEEGLKRQLAEAQLKTMQAQVEPHFLFNTLASVDYLIETDPTRASRMQKNLIQYLRAALPQMRQASSTLGQEMALCRSYLEILKMRMDDRLQFAITMPAGLSTAAFPPMMLQTLVENSIKHGLEPKPEGGMLTLSADVVDGNLRVTVSDTGLGFGAAGLAGGGVGLNNVRERLQAVFGSRGRLTIEPNSPAGTIATIAVPYALGAAEGVSQPSPQPA